MPPLKQPSQANTNPKLPPQNIDAECSVLGAILIDKDAIFKVIDILEPRDFYLPAHERIYETLLELAEKNQPVDIIALTNRLKEKGILKDIGGSSYLAELTQSITTASHVGHFARLVKEKKTLRDLIRASSEITEQAFAPASEMEDLLDSIEQKIMSISQKSLPKNFISIKDELSLANERFANLQDNKGALRGIATGFPTIDSILSGLQRSDLVILGARPSLGKTSLALDIARNAAVSYKYKVGIFSLEMSREQVVDRVISAQSRVPLWKLRTGKQMGDSDRAFIVNSFDKLSQSSIFIDDTASPNIMQMRAMARRLQLEHGLDLLVVDYLQLIMPRKHSDNVVHQITEISRGLKGLARELNVPILALSQLSRAVDQRDHKEPKLHDLRESGSIEQDADVVLFIYRKDREKAEVPPDEKGVAEIIIAKHRNGALGRVRMKFNEEFASFSEEDARHQISPTEFSHATADPFDDPGF